MPQLEMNGTAGADLLDASGLAVSAVLRGYEGNDTLLGGSGSDRLAGHAGFNLLNGGAGDDLLFVAPNVGEYDTVIGGLGSDTLVVGITAAQYADPAIRAALSQLDYFIARNGTDPTAHFVSAALHLDMSGVEQTDVRIEASLHPVNTVVPGPFAVVFSNETASYAGTDYTQAARWVVDGTNFVRGTTFGTVERAWQLVDTGDFNGDLKVDMLWQNRATGDVAVWVMDGDTFQRGQTVYTAPAGESWKIAGSADFTGDGRSDILLAATVVDPSSGLSYANLKLLQVQADGVTFESATAMPAAGAGWSVAGVGDFDGDGRADILWRYSTGLTAVWEMDGTTVLRGDTLADVGLDWRVAGTGDFDGDGRSDILWRNVDGKVAIWEMAGLLVRASATVADPGTEWVVAGVADHNGDGRADILWRHAPVAGSGVTEMQVWTMNGLNVTAVGTLAYDIPNDWQTV